MLVVQRVNGGIIECKRPKAESMVIQKETQSKQQLAALFFSAVLLPVFKIMNKAKLIEHTSCGVLMTTPPHES